jgi:hypothetical protein
VFAANCRETVIVMDSVANPPPPCFSMFIESNRPSLLPKSVYNGQIVRDFMHKDSRDNRKITSG